MRNYLNLIRNKLLSQHIYNMQAALQVDYALRGIEHNIELLEKLGHLFYLTPGKCPDEIANAWGPKIVWHADGRCKEVFTPKELTELGPGWAESLAEAKIIDGRAKQFAGRGGVKRNPDNLPMVLDLSSPVSFFEKETDRKARIKLWKEQRDGN